MYIKFCRNYEGDKKDKVNANMSSDSKLCVLLEGDKGAWERFSGVHFCIALTSDPFCSFQTQREGSKERRKDTSVQNSVPGPVSHLLCPAADRHFPLYQMWVSAALDRLDRTCLPSCSHSCPFLNVPPFSSPFQSQPDHPSAQDSSQLPFPQPAASKPARRSTTSPLKVVLGRKSCVRCF